MVTFNIGGVGSEPWVAGVPKENLGIYPCPMPFTMGMGATEIEALECLARINNLKLWDEE